MRYSFDEGLIDLAKGQVVPFAELLGELLTLTSDDAAALGCTAEVNSLRDILTRGTSAHRQLQTFKSARDDGASEDDALKAVVDQLVEDTTTGL
jgi:carboxylate-amine ligase